MRRRRTIQVRWRLLSRQVDRRKIQRRKREWNWLRLRRRICCVELFGLSCQLLYKRQGIRVCWCLLQSTTNPSAISSVYATDDSISTYPLTG